MAAAVRLVLVLTIILASWSAVEGGEYDFDIPEAEKSNLEFGGKVEFQLTHHQLDRDSLPYKLRFPEGGQDHWDEWRPFLELNAGYNFGPARVFLSVHNEYLKDDWDEDWTSRVYEGRLTIQPTPGAALEIGKKTFLWGKGYAWNPVGFINRPKDPDDPELNLEGYTGVSLDLIKSFQGGPLKTLAFTPVILPVLDWENDDLGKQGEVNHAFKLYFLIEDVDLDLIYAGGPSRPDSLGFDFSANLKENLEVHGELAVVLDADKTTVDAAGKKNTTKEDQVSWLFGLRYLSSLDTTYILEYYRNGAGYRPAEIDAFFKYQEAAYRQYLAKGQVSALKEAAKTASGYYSRRNYGLDYLYLKISQKEPFDILYFTPYVAAMLNLGDSSLSLTPGFTYLPWTNFEFGWKIMVPVGRPGTEFGEKQDAFQSKVTLAYYF
ncbi:MAG: hypothetical protein V1816_13145 [Pseudomonadota bacterium]